jgi:hypothetical protein
MVVVELLDGSDSEELAVHPEAEEGDARFEKTVEVEGVDVLRRAVLPAIHEVPFEERADVVASRVIDLDDGGIHEDVIPARPASASTLGSYRLLPARAINDALPDHRVMGRGRLADQ